MISCLLDDTDGENALVDVASSAAARRDDGSVHVMIQLNDVPPSHNYLTPTLYLVSLGGILLKLSNWYSGTVAESRELSRYY